MSAPSTDAPTTDRSVGARDAAAASAAAHGYSTDGGAPIGSVDVDGDGLTDDFERSIGTNSSVADTDADGLSDGYEMLSVHTNPLVGDTDSDGMDDAAEAVAGTDAGTGPGITDMQAATGMTPGSATPGSAAGSTASSGTGDADGDGLTDSYEVATHTNPAVADTDGDGLVDSLEIRVGTSPTSVDTDQDGMTDASEVHFGTNPLVAEAPGTMGIPAAAPAVVPPTTTVIVVNPSAAEPNPGSSAAHTTTGTSVPSTTASGDVQAMLDKALKQVGDQYVFGAEVSDTDPDPSVWDCAELTQWSAYQAGAEIPGSSYEQYLDLKAKGLLIPVEQAENTPGALLFHFSEEPTPGGGRPGEAHVALSLGHGKTVEAQSEETGVVTDESAGRFEYGALLPNVDYGTTATVAPDTAQPVVATDNTDAAGLNLDEVIYGIKMQESHGDYQAENPTSTASGAYQYIDGTWDSYGGYSHASDAPPDVQDAKMRADTQAAYDRLGDWERVIASHFAGEGGQEGPKSDWTKVPGYEYNHNPSIREYVDGVRGYIETADPSAFADTSTTPVSTATSPETTTDPVTHSTGAAGAAITVININNGGLGTVTPGLGTAPPGLGTVAPGLGNLAPGLATLAPGVAAYAGGFPVPNGSAAGAGGVPAGSTPVTSPPPSTTTGGGDAALGGAGTGGPPSSSADFTIDPGTDISNPEDDSDGDGLTNGFEAQIHSDLTVADTDGDGLIDGVEWSMGTDPLSVDTDRDGLTDGAEMRYHLNPLAPSLGELHESGPAADGGGMDDHSLVGHDVTLP